MVFTIRLKSYGFWYVTVELCSDLNVCFLTLGLSLKCSLSELLSSIFSVFYYVYLVPATAVILLLRRSRSKSILSITQVSLETCVIVFTAGLACCLASPKGWLVAIPAGRLDPVVNQRSWFTTGSQPSGCVK